ncbi:hypothetical protein BN1086_04849 [Citrobacter koseri]|uniref:Uncharacterized protein n=1 Tax=Citrobacter koseri TaxID=545 RepID=A0A078LRV2_CITKO|nr:hypothetical protein BN1086_04849 [Citrobacter koseri]
MEWLAALLSLINQNPWAGTILATFATALAGMFTFHLKERGRRRMKRYELTLEHYNAYSCLMFTAMDALCTDKGFEKVQTRICPNWCWKSLPMMRSMTFCVLRGGQRWLPILWRVNG